MVFHALCPGFCSLPVTQFLCAISSFRFIFPSFDQWSWFHLWLPSWVTIFKTLFPYFCFRLTADMFLILCPLPLAITLTNWKLPIKACGYHLECSDSYSLGATMTSFVLSQQWYFPFLGYYCSCSLYSLFACYLLTVLSPVNKVFISAKTLNQV